MVGFGFGLFGFDFGPGVIRFLGSSFIFSCGAVFFKSCRASSCVGWVVLFDIAVSEAVYASDVVGAVAFCGCVHGVAHFLGVRASVAARWVSVLVVFFLVGTAADAASRV